MSTPEKRGRGRPISAPCGTYAAARRHERNHEPLDPACLEARKEYHRVMKQQNRQRKAAKAAEAG